MDKREAGKTPKITDQAVNLALMELISVQNMQREPERYSDVDVNAFGLEKRVKRCEGVLEAAGRERVRSLAIGGLHRVDSRLWATYDEQAVAQDIASQKVNSGEVTVASVTEGLIESTLYSIINQNPDALPGLNFMAQRRLYSDAFTLVAKAVSSQERNPNP